jgi:rRNA-processing protein FCF1
MPLRVVFDSNAVDPLIDQPGSYELLREAIDTGRLEVLFTHVTIDELAEVPDESRRDRLRRAITTLGRKVPTGAFILDYSRLDEARLGDDVSAVAALRSNNIRHSNDALIAVTPSYEQCHLITHERRLTGRAREQGIPVLTFAELLVELQQTDL